MGNAFSGSLKYKNRSNTSQDLEVSEAHCLSPLPIPHTLISFGSRGEDDEKKRRKKGPYGVQLGVEGLAGG
jgi:hypothetical protein